MGDTCFFVHFRVKKAHFTPKSVKKCTFWPYLCILVFFGCFSSILAVFRLFLPILPLFRSFCLVFDKYSYIQSFCPKTTNFARFHQKYRLFSSISTFPHHPVFRCSGTAVLRVFVSFRDQIYQFCCPLLRITRRLSEPSVHSNCLVQI